MLISENTNRLLNLLVQKGFILNRLWDRGLSVLNIDFAMNNFEKIFHTGLAHKFPVEWSDRFSEIQSKYNIMTEYLETPTDISLYKTPLEFFEKNLVYHESVLQLLKDTIRVANESGDFNVSGELMDFMEDFNNYMNQAILLVDKAKLIGNDYAKFDDMADKFYLF